jgi:hypothetical protein
MIRTYKVNRSQIKGKLDMVIVPFDYIKQWVDENVFTIYIGGEIPVRVSSRTITEEQFAKMCGDV